MIIEHGTYAGWNAHNRVPEEPCRECKDARTRYQWERRNRIGTGRAVTWPIEVRSGMLDMPALGAAIAESFRESA